MGVSTPIIDHDQTIDVAAADRSEGHDPKDARIAELEAKNAELEAVLAKLVARIEELEEKLRRNSGNSHLPPSSDGPGSATGKKGKKSKGKRKRGGQKGHRGAHRVLVPVEQVDELVQLFPRHCDGCGAQLPETLDVDARRYQVLDLPVGGRHITEYRRHEIECPCCGHRTRAPYDAEKIPTSPFGPQLVARVAMFTGNEVVGADVVCFFGAEDMLGPANARSTASAA